VSGCRPLASRSDAMHQTGCCWCLSVGAGAHNLVGGARVGAGIPRQTNRVRVRARVQHMPYLHVRSEALWAGRLHLRRRGRLPTGRQRRSQAERQDSHTTASQDEPNAYSAADDLFAIPLGVA
jgi:hypothetical protein